MSCTVLRRIEILTLIEMPTPLHQNEVASLLQTLDWASMLQDDYDQVMEMQAEALSRLARLNIVQNNAHGAQLLAERCLSLVAHAMDREQSGTGEGECFTKQKGPKYYIEQKVCDT